MDRLHWQSLLAKPTASHVTVTTVLAWPPRAARQKIEMTLFFGQGKQTVTVAVTGAIALTFADGNAA